MSKGHSGKPSTAKSSGPAKTTPMTSARASRIQSAGDRNPNSATTQSRFVARAQRAATQQKIAK